SYAMPDYLSSLPEPERQRYRDKLCVDGVAFDDPYAVNKACWTSDVKLLPPKSTAHVVVYLVFSPSQFTADTVAYKSLEAYDYFESVSALPAGSAVCPVANRTEHTYESGGAGSAIKATAKSPVYNAETASSTLAHLKADSPLDAASRDASSSMDSKSEDLVGHPGRFMKLDEKPHVVNPISQEPPVHVLSKPHVVDVIQNPTINLAAKPQVLFGPSREPSVNVEAKPQVLDPDTNPLGNYKEKPNTLKATYPDGYGFAVGNVQVPPTPRPPGRREGQRWPIVMEPRPLALAPSLSKWRDASIGVSGGCFYKSERYEHGDVVSTPEPCLNCTCQKGVLVCYLRVCPTTGTPAPGCFTAREAGECCPNVFCSEITLDTTTSLEEQATRYDSNLTTGVPTKGPEAAVREPVADDEAANSVEAGDHTARDSVMLVSSTPLPYEVHHSFDLQDLNTISG
ncbi:hypothetical protein HPB47_009626, partial [Ixodes persulcatus]